MTDCLALRMADKVRLTSQIMTEEGLSPEDLANRATEAGLVRVRRGAWSSAEVLPPDEAHLRLAHAVELQHRDPVFSHVTAATAWGLPVDRRTLDRVWVTRRTGHSHGRRLRDVRESETPLRDDEVTMANGLVVTSVARTVVDVARMCSLEWGVIAADAALNQKLCTPDELSDAIAAARRRRGVSRATRAVRFADGDAESPLESVSRLSLARAGLPTPELQHAILLNGRRVARCDFAWPEYGVVGECDGAVKYGKLLKQGQSPEQAVMAEKHRENLIREADWWIVRWGWEIAWDIPRLAARVQTALKHGGTPHLASA